ncbi:hypothetical protein ACQCVP_06195 [Rossellomorea vietnamensis]
MGTRKRLPPRDDVLKRQAWIQESVDHQEMMFSRGGLGYKKASAAKR